MALAVKNPALLEQTEIQMSACLQNEMMSVQLHGRRVSYYAMLLFLEAHRLSDPQYVADPHLKLPSWFVEHGKRLFDLIPDPDAFYQYTDNHDCGKPSCRIVDEAGKQHFPNHAQVSYERWCAIDGDGYVAQCILHDMDIHTIKADGVAAFAALPQAPSLLIAGLAEIHANAEMFGGFLSQGFHIKFAQIFRRGKDVCKILFPTK